MNITRCSIISRRRAERDNGERCFFRELCLRKNDAIVQKKRKNIICLMCVGHMMHMKHMKLEKGFFERTAGMNAVQRMGDVLLPPPTTSFHRPRTPSTAHGAVPLPRRGRSGGFAGQGLPALSSIAYRGFAVAPMTLRAPARRVIITSGINGRAMRAPTGDGGATDGCKYI